MTALRSELAAPGSNVSSGAVGIWRQCTARSNAPSARGTTSFWVKKKNGHPHPTEQGYSKDTVLLPPRQPTLTAHMKKNIYCRRFASSAFPRRHGGMKNDISKGPYRSMYRTGFDEIESVGKPLFPALKYTFRLLENTMYCNRVCDNATSYVECTPRRMRRYTSTCPLGLQGQWVHLRPLLGHAEPPLVPEVSGQGRRSRSGQQPKSTFV